MGRATKGNHMISILDALAKKGVLVSDGAWGTFLAAKGLAVGECPELWNIEHPDDVADVARAYAEAGSDLVSTNSFGGSRFKLDHFGLGERVGELNETAAALTRTAVGPDVHVTASVGPTGKILMMGDVTEEQLYDAFREQIVALERGGADACVIETMTAIDEAVTAIRAAKENTSLEVICTFTYDKIGEDMYRTMMGVSPADMAAAVLDAGADVIGSNCGQGLEGMVEIAAQLRAAAPGTPIMVQANAGLPTRVDGVDTFPETPEDMAARVPALIEAGAGIVGGCCGTTPAHIAAIAKAARETTA